MTTLLGTTWTPRKETFVVVKQCRQRLELRLSESALHTRRLQLGLSQERMARGLGIRQSTYSKIEAGLSPCPPDYLTKELKLS